MNAVCALDHFAGLIEAKPANRDLLLAMDEHEFITAMNRWRDQFLIKIDQPVMGLNDEELRSIGVPTAIVPYYDRMHPHTFGCPRGYDDSRQPLIRLRSPST